MHARIYACLATYMREEVLEAQRGSRGCQEREVDGPLQPKPQSSDERLLLLVPGAHPVAIRAQRAQGPGLISCSCVRSPPAGLWGGCERLAVGSLRYGTPHPIRGVGVFSKAERVRRRAPHACMDLSTLQSGAHRVGIYSQESCTLC